MDLLTLIKPEELQAFAENYNYKTSGYMGQMLFPAEKTKNIKVSYRSLVNGGDLPVMAQVHALDTEARIGDRPNYKEVELKKLLIKEKLDQGESVAYFRESLGGGSEKDLVEYIFNDAANLISRVITRTEVANMELLSTGKMTIKENNVDTVIDFGFSNENKIALAGWSSPEHGILSDLTKIKKKAKAKGWDVVRAITSSTVIGYMLANKEIQGYWEKKVEPITETAMLSWINSYFGIEFVTNDDVYKTSALATEQKRFYKENAITFLGTRGVLGKGLFGYTPEELKLSNTSTRNLCTLTMWDEKDPATTWTKASGMYLPVVRNIDKMIIATVS